MVEKSVLLMYIQNVILNKRIYVMNKFIHHYTHGCQANSECQRKHIKSSIFKKKQYCKNLRFKTGVLIAFVSTDLQSRVSSNQWFIDLTTSSKKWRCGALPCDGWLRDSCRGFPGSAESEVKHFTTKSRCSRTVAFPSKPR